MRTTIGIATFLAVGAGAVSVSALNLLGSDTLKDLTVTLLTSSTLECGGVGEPTSDGVAGTLVYEGTGSGNGQAAMVGGTQEVAPMSSRMSTAVCATAPGKAEGIVFALDAISIVANNTTVANAAGVCNGTQAGCNVDGASGGLGHTSGLRFSFAGDGTAAPPALTSCTASQVVDWHDVLRLIYFGIDATTIGSASATTQACNSPCRTELANGYAKLFQSSCTVGNSCTQLRHAFRRNDESGTTDVFRTVLGFGSIAQKDNFVLFCNNGTTGPAMNPASPLKSCTAAADCQASGAPGTGTCDSTSTSRTFHLCTKQTCNTTADCPANTGGTAPCVANVCQLEAITATQKNVANHGLQNCLADADCLNGNTCDLKSSRCLCATNADCATGATCTAGAAANGTSSACVNQGTATPEPSHIIETTTAYGPAGSWVDMQDADPIRRACGFTGGNPTEDICNRDGKLGLVLPIWDATTTGSTTPAVPAVAAADAFPAQSCDTGKFACYPATRFALDSGNNSIFDLCPDGSNPNLPPATNPNVCPQGQCARPVHVNGSTQDPRCISGRGNLPAPLATPNDGRVYNLIVWQQLQPSGAFVIGRYPRSTGQGSATLFGTSGFVNMSGAFFRLHQNTPTISGLGACQATSATDQIGCLARASWCSIGYAGNSAVQGATTSINVNNVTANDNTCTQNLITKPANDPATYRIARRLFLNSVKGFTALDPTLNPTEGNDQKNEFKLAQCFGDDDSVPSHGQAQHIATATPPSGFGFIPLPSSVNGGQPFCDDVALNVCGQTAACPNNTSNIPTFSVAF